MDTPALQVTLQTLPLPATNTLTRDIRLGGGMVGGGWEALAALPLSETFHLVGFRGNPEASRPPSGNLGLLKLNPNRQV